MGSSFIFDPVYINVSVPGKAIKKPIEELIAKLIILDDGISLFTIIGFC